MAETYQTAIKFAHRYLVGYLHHSIMASFFDLLKMPITADNQRKNAMEDAKKRSKIDEYIVHTYERMPEYTASNIQVVAKEIASATNESIKANKPEWLKRGVEALIRYEKDTIAFLDSFVKEAEQLKDNKLAEWIKRYIEDAKSELEVIEHFKGELEKHNFDYEKYKEKEKQDMPRYYRDDRHDRRRDERYAPMGDDRFMPYMDDDMDEGEMDDRFFRPFYYPSMPYYMDDDRRYDEPMYEDRRGVPGTGPYARRRRRRYR